MPAKRLIERLMIEHMHHGGTMNGELTVTYDQFEEFGLTRRSIRPAIELCSRLGLVDITYSGSRSYGAAKRPSTYGLTWLPRNDGTPPSNRWNAIKSREQAEAIVARAYVARDAQKTGSAASAAVNG